MYIKSFILGAVICCIADSRPRVLRQATPQIDDSNHTGHSFVNATGFESAMQQWLDVIYHAAGGVRFGAGGVAKGDNNSLVITSGAGATTLSNGSTDGSSASSNVTAIGVETLAQGNSTGQEFNGTQWATADGLALGFGQGQSAAGISGAVQTMNKNITNPFGVNSLSGGSQAAGSGDTNSVVQLNQNLTFDSILAELTANAQAQSVNQSSAAVEGAYDGVNGKLANFTADTSMQSGGNSTSQADGTILVANKTHIITASVSGGGGGQGSTDISSNAAVSDKKGGIVTNNGAQSIVDVGQSAVDSESDLTRISNGTNQVSNTVSGDAFGLNRTITADSGLRQYDKDNNTQTMASGNGQSEGSGNVNGNSSITSLTNQGNPGQPAGATVLVVSSGSSESQNNGTAAMNIRNTGQLESSGQQSNGSGQVVSSGKAFGDFANTTGDAQLILGNNGSTVVGDHTAFAEGANYAQVNTEIGLDQQDVFGNRTKTLNGTAVAKGDEVLVQSQQGLADVNGVASMGSSQTANSSGEKTASASASAQLVLPNFNINFGKRRKRSAPLVESFNFTRVCFNKTAAICQLYLVQVGPDSGAIQLHSLSQDQLSSLLTTQSAAANDETDAVTNVAPKSNSDFQFRNFSSSDQAISATASVSSQTTSSSKGNTTMVVITQTTPISSPVSSKLNPLAAEIIASVQQTLSNAKTQNGQFGIFASSVTHSNGSQLTSVAMASETRGR